MSVTGERKSIDVLLNTLGIKALKSFGQNFLVNTDIADKIVKEVPEEGLGKIVEIGPGLGVLTSRLLDRGANITAIEKDRVLAEYLEKNLSGDYSGSLEVINNDAMEVIGEYLRTDSYLISNLPFNISSRLTGRILDEIPFVNNGENPFKGAVIMYQEEFTNRLISEHGGKEYGRISVMFRSKMDFSHVIDVPRNSFYPVPKVNGKVIRFQPKNKFESIPVNEDIFRKLVHVTFLNRRKKLRNSVNPRAVGLELEMADIEWILDDLDLTDRRPEELPPEMFIELSNRLADLL